MGNHCYLIPLCVDWFRLFCSCSSTIVCQVNLSIPVLFPPIKPLYFFWDIVCSQFKNLFFPVVSSIFRWYMYFLWKLLLWLSASVLKQALKHMWEIPRWVLTIWFHNMYVLNINFETKVDVIKTIWKITTGQLAVWPKSWDFNVANFLWLLGVGLACSWHSQVSPLWPSTVLWDVSRNFFLELDSSWLCAWATGNPLLKDASEILWR